MHRLFLLGRIDFRDDQGNELRSVLAQPKRLALVAYLAANAGRTACRRDALIGLFWPELTQERARKALNKAIHFARQALGESAIVSRNAEELAIDAQRVWCDVAAFEAAAADGHLADALDLYQGDLLPGFYIKEASAFEEWLEIERSRLRRLAADAAHRAAAEREQSGHVTAAANYARQAVELSDANERVMRDLLSMLDRLGDRAGALHAYEAFARRLVDEFGAEPAAETQALVTQIRSRAKVREPATVYLATDAQHSAAHDRFPSAPVFTSARASLDGSRRASIAIRREKILAAARWTAAAAVVGLAAWGWFRPAPRVAAKRARLELVVPDSERVRADLPGLIFTLAPDGSRIVYLGGSGTPRLYLRGLNDVDAKPIRGTEDATMPRVSPDGRWIAFVQSRTLKKVPTSGGPPVTIIENVTNYDWGDRDVIVFTRGKPSSRPDLYTSLYRVSGTGEQPRLIVAADSARGESIILPHVLPGGTAAVFGIAPTGDRAHTELAAARFSDGKVIRLGVTGLNPRYVTSGHLLFGRLDGSTVAVPFDAKRLRVTGPAVTMLERMSVQGGGATQVAVSPDGTLAYIEADPLTRLVLIGRDGRTRQVLLSVPEYAYPRLSPAGDRIALRLSDTLGYQHNDVWVYHIATATLSRLTNDGKSDRPEWSADGRRIMWLYRDSTGIQLRRQAWDGSGKPEILLASKDFTGGAIVASPRGKLLAGVWRGKDTKSDIFVANGDPPGAPRPLVATPAQEGAPKISPDGKWVAYYGEESGAREVYVTAVTGTGGRHQISTAGGVEPVWGRDGKTLYYRSAGKLMMATIATSPEFVVVRRDSLFTHDYATSSGAAGFDVSPDGKTFVMLRHGDQPQRVIVAFGWLDELRERTAQAGRK